MSALPKRFFTQAEYALLEEHAAYKSQYVAGEIFAMAGVQPWHDDIVRNLTITLGLRFQGRPCRIHSADVKVRAKAGDLWTYPDLSVVCGERRYDTSANPHSLLNPAGDLRGPFPLDRSLRPGRQVHPLSGHRVADRLRPGGF